MVRCINPRCSRELDPEWAFCDLCGKDNRPPAARVRIDEDEHLAPHGEFCVRCGVSLLDLNDVDDDDNRLRVYGGWAALIVGALSLCLSMALRPPVGVQEAPTYPIAYTAARYGSYLLAAGVILLLITPAIKKKR